MKGNRRWRKEPHVNSFELRCFRYQHSLLFKVNYFARSSPHKILSIKLLNYSPLSWSWRIFAASSKASTLIFLEIKIEDVAFVSILCRRVCYWARKHQNNKSRAPHTTWLELVQPLAQHLNKPISKREVSLKGCSHGRQNWPRGYIHDYSKWYNKASM